MHDAAIDLKSEAARLRAILIGSVGNLVEWYDFYVYSAFSLYFADSFFPGEDPLAQMMSASGVFALGFLMRPIGAYVFGRIGDGRGRRAALMLSVLLMCLGSLLIALAPTYATIGVGAPATLLFARLVQGVSLGGEYGSSATYLAEMAHPERRGFYSSFQYVTMIAGQLLALCVLLILQNVALDAQALRDWGWRIPFAFGALLAIVALYMRRDLVETPAFKASRAERRRGSLSALLAHKRETATVVGLTLGGTHRLLCLYDLHAEILEALRRIERCGDDLDCGRLAALRALSATDLRRLVGPHRPPADAHRLRRAGNDLHRRRC